ncbi:MAG: hypothetical protein GYA15_01185 [Leptolinea sp.]|jgi:hypothetical protein|nr:hypothetical protein [Leptolinea sp.]
MTLLTKIKHFLVVPHDRILSAISDDGIHWKREPGIRKDYGGIHRTVMAYYSYVHQPADFCGDYEMYYHNSSLIDGKWHGNIVRSRSTDGLRWSDIEKPVVSGGVSDQIDRQVRAPFLLKSDSGWTLFFSALGMDGKTRIFSTYSENRQDWRLSSRPVLDPEDCRKLDHENWGRVNGVSDPFIVRLPTNNYRMYFSCIFSRINDQLIASAVSDDGLRWEIEDGYRIPAGPVGQYPCACNPCVIPFGEGWRIYFRRAEIYPIWNTIYTAYSTDGLSFEAGVECLKYQRWNFHERNAVGFPFVLPLTTGGYRMYYTGYWGFLFDQKIIKEYTELDTKTRIR